MKSFNRTILKSFCSKETLPLGLKSQLDFLDKKKHCFEEIFPISFNSKLDANTYLAKDSISTMLSFADKEVPKSIEQGILTPGWDLLNRGGKKWRPVLGLLVGKLLGGKYIVPEDIVVKLVFLTELLHNASLIIDDIEDKSEKRRNKPCVHLIYGEDVSINAGISMMFIPFYTLLNALNKEVNNKEIFHNITMSFMKEMTALHIGQNLDIEMKYSRIPQVESYFDVVLAKTGVMPRLVIKFILDTINREGLSNPTWNNKSLSIDDYLIQMADHLSVAFQIKDDLLNILPSKVSANKGLVGEDIFEGKQSLMVLHSLNQRNKMSERLREILFMKTKDQKLINEAIEILKNLGSIKYAEEEMHRRFNESMSMCRGLDKVAKNKEAIGDIEELARYLVDRM